VKPTCGGIHTSTTYPYPSRNLGFFTHLNFLGTSYWVSGHITTQSVEFIRNRFSGTPQLQLPSWPPLFLRVPAAAVTPVSSGKPREASPRVPASFAPLQWVRVPGLLLAGKGCAYQREQAGSSVRWRPMRKLKLLNLPSRGCIQMAWCS